MRLRTIGLVLSPVLATILFLALPSQVSAQPAPKKPAASKPATPKKPGPLATASQSLVATACDPTLKAHVYTVCAVAGHSTLHRGNGYDPSHQKRGRWRRPHPAKT